MISLLNCVGQAFDRHRDASRAPCSVVRTIRAWLALRREGRRLSLYAVANLTKIVTPLVSRVEPGAGLFGAEPTAQSTKTFPQLTGHLDE